MINILIALIGLSGGIVIGSATASFLTILDLVPRLAQITNSSSKIRIYEVLIVIATASLTLMDLLNINLSINRYITIPIGLVLGIFVGLFASALAEVLNVIPILSKRAGVQKHIHIILASIIAGKVMGSLFHWLILVKY